MSFYIQSLLPYIHFQKINNKNKNVKITKTVLFICNKICGAC